MVKLTTKQVEYWENLIKESYEVFKNKVRKEFEEQEYPPEIPLPDSSYKAHREFVKKWCLKYVDTMLELLCDGQEGHNISHYADHRTLTLPNIDDIPTLKAQYEEYIKLDKERDEKIHQIDLNKCQHIRDICEPICAERDRLIRLIYKPSLTREEIDEVEAWCLKCAPDHEVKCSL